MKFSKETISELVWGGDWIDPDTGQKFKYIENEMVDKSRWYIHYNFIFSVDDKFYEVSYRRGATEMQDEGMEFDDEDSDGMVECQEVEPYEVTVIKYRPVE